MGMASYNTLVYLRKSVLSLFEGILTPAQLQTYKQAQLHMIEMPMMMLPRRVGP